MGMSINDKSVQVSSQAYLKLLRKTTAGGEVACLIEMLKALHKGN